MACTPPRSARWLFVNVLARPNLPRPTLLCVNSRVRRCLWLSVIVLAVASIAPQSALAAVSVSRAEVNNGSLRIEGRAIANRTITVDGVAMATSSGSGAFRISRSSYTPPSDCTVDVNDGSVLTVARLTGCTVTTAPPTAAPYMTPDVAGFTANVGTPFLETFAFFPASLANSPVVFRIESGALPAGLALTPIPITSPRPFPENGIRVQGTPITVQTSSFVLRATDANGVTATRTYTIAVGAPRPLTITPHQWGPLAEGSPQNLFLDGDGGVKPYSWSISAGTLPPGMSVIQDAATVGLVRIGGTPTTAGTYAFTLRLTDALGTTLDRAFSASVSAPIVGVLHEVAVQPSVVGGATPIATVRFSPAPGSGGASVALSSSNPGVAGVPTTVTVPAGDTIGAFPVTTSAVTANTTVTITATHAGVTRSTTLTITPPPTTTPPPPTPDPDTVTITRVEYDSAKRQLRVEATSSRTGATLRVHMTSSDALIGTLAGGVGQFAVGSNPQNITVRSSLGGNATLTVRAK